MLNEKEASDLIRSDKKKKTVSWNDKKTEGKIDASFLEVNKAATPSKSVLDATINKLIVEKGYPEIEAATSVGKPITPSGEILYNNPKFYESKESIKQRLSLEKEKPKEENESNRYSFFSMSNLSIGIGALAAVAVVGIVASRSK